MKPVIIKDELHDPAADRTLSLTKLLVGRPAAPAVVPAAVEQRMAAILDGEPRPGESIAAAYQRKERELAALFATLPAAEAAVLQRRLAAPGDPAAAAFARLTGERRARLLAYLGDARRREARRA